MENINTISLDKRAYEDDKDFWGNVALIMKVLIKAGYTISIRYEDCDIYVIEFDYTNEDWAHFIPWVDAKEYDKAMTLLYGCKEDTF